MILFICNTTQLLPSHSDIEEGEGDSRMLITAKEMRGDRMIQYQGNHQTIMDKQIPVKTFQAENLS